MDEFVGLLIRQAGKAYTEAQQKAAAERAAAARAVPTAPAAAAPPSTAPLPVAVAPAPPTASLAMSPEVLVPVADLVVPVAPVHSSKKLLAAFSGASALLAGIVLSEALAPPVSLRSEQLFDRITH